MSGTGRSGCLTVGAHRRGSLRTSACVPASDGGWGSPSSCKGPGGGVGTPPCRRGETTPILRNICPWPLFVLSALQVRGISVLCLSPGNRFSDPPEVRNVFQKNTLRLCPAACMGYALLILEVINVIIFTTKNDNRMKL